MNTNLQHTVYGQLLSSPAFQAAKKQLLDSVTSASKSITGVKKGSDDSKIREEYQRLLQEFTKSRGRDLFYPFVGSGIGNGPLIEMADGAVKYDMITGIGINFFGHSHPKMMDAMVDAMPADTMQGNLQPGAEAKDLMKLLVEKASQGSNIQHVWYATCGTMANEIALKIIRQKKAPATKIFAFEDCFSGRSTAMQEITDNPKYREGQPVYGEVEYLPFYNPSLGLEKSLENTLGKMKSALNRYPGKFSCVMMELVQGEGGFNAAPKEFYVRLFEEAKKAGLAIWADEVQTFGRTGELFAFQKFGIGQYVDVVTVGKMLQACATFFTAEYAPKPGLVAGTFSGSTVALKTAKTVIEVLENEGWLGESGKIAQHSERFRAGLEKMAQGSCKGFVSNIRNIGGMIAFQPGAGTMDEVKKYLMKLFDNGVVAFNCGHGPYLVRMLPPLVAMNEKHIDEVLSILEKTLVESYKG